MISHTTPVEGGMFIHHPPFKVAINSVLRFFQKDSRKPLLLASIIDIENDQPVRLVGYKFMRVSLR